MDTDLVTLEDIKGRILPGAIMPAGLCPDCGDLCYVDKPTLTDAWLTQLRVNLNGIERSFAGLKDQMIEVDAPPTVFAMGGILSTAFVMFKRTLSEEMGLVLIPQDVLQSLQEAVLDAAGIEDAELVDTDEGSDDENVPDAEKGEVQ
jgi:hypothetical protein